MRPTPEETLAGAERLLRATLEEPELPPDAAATLADVVRMLGHLRRSVADRPDFLAADNERLRALLADLIRELPPTGLASRERIQTYLVERAALDPR